MVQKGVVKLQYISIDEKIASFSQTLYLEWSLYTKKTSLAWCIMSFSLRGNVDVFAGLGKPSLESSCWFAQVMLIWLGEIDAFTRVAMLIWLGVNGRRHLQNRANSHLRGHADLVGSCWFDHRRLMHSPKWPCWFDWVMLIWPRVNAPGADHLQRGHVDLARSCWFDQGIWIHLPEKPCWFG